MTLAIAWWVAHSRLGMGLFAIHDDEDVAEAKGVPTFRYKLIAFALSAGIAGAVGGVHAMYVGFLTVSGTFELTVPLYVVLMSVLGGSRHWFGPAIGATVITTLLYAFISGGEAMIGRAIVGVILIVGDPVAARRRRCRPPEVAGQAPAARGRKPPSAEVAPVVPPAQAGRRRAYCCEVRARHQAVRRPAGAGRRRSRRARGRDPGAGRAQRLGQDDADQRHLRLLSADLRQLTVAGVEIGNLPAHEIASRGVARTYQIPRPFVNMTVLENVVLAATFGSPSRPTAEIRDEALHWIGFTGLSGKEDVLPAGLNLHERKFLELARALAAEPKLLLLDEVLSGLNPAEVDNAIRLVRAIRAQGATIVFVEHLMRAVVELSDRVAVLNEGKLFALGAPREVMRDPRVVSIYLGKAYAA